MTKPHHDKTEFEFIAKRINNMLERQFPDKNLCFLTMIMDAGSEGYLGYVANLERIDAIRVVAEWMSKTIGGLSKDDFEDMLTRLKQEKWPND